MKKLLTIVAAIAMLPFASANAGVASNALTYNALTYNALTYNGLNVRNGWRLNGLHLNRLCNECLNPVGSAAYAIDLQSLAAAPLLK